MAQLYFLEKMICYLIEVSNARGTDPWVQSGHGFTPPMTRSSFRLPFFLPGITVKKNSTGNGSIILAWA